MILFLLFSFLFAKEKEYLPPLKNSCLIFYSNLSGQAKTAKDIEDYVLTILGLKKGFSLKEDFYINANIVKIFPYQDENIRNAIADRLRDLETDFSREDLKQAFYGKQAKAIFIVTHQAQKLTDQTTELLKDKKFENIPRLFLASSSYPIHSKELLNQATEVRYSAGGESDLKLHTNVLHFAGGYCDLCLANTIKDTLSNVVTNEKEIEVIIHSSITYGLLEPSKDLLNEILNNDKKREWYYEFTGSASDHYFFKRLSDNKKIKIIFENP